MTAANLSARPEAVFAHRRNVPTRFRSTCQISFSSRALGTRWQRRRAFLTVARAETVTDAAASDLPIEKSSTALPAVMDIQRILEILPHRFPFLLVDRVVDYEAQKYAVGYKNITINDQFFPGHFPQRAIMPGVLQIEAMAQLGGICMIDPNSESEKNNFFFGGIDNCKFRKPVVPGDTLMMRVDVTKYNKRYGIAKLDAKAYVGTALVSEAELTLVMGK